MTPDPNKLIAGLKRSMADYSMFAVYVYRGGVKIGERIHLNIPPEDYARHWDLEGPR